MSVAAQLLDAFNRLPTDEQKQAISDAEAILQGMVFTPQEGPQTDAYFSDADELLYGGQAGGGKSAFLVGYGLNEAIEGVIFRNGFKNLIDLENFAISLLGTDKGLSRQLHTISLPNNRSLEFASLEQPGSELDRQGRRRDFIGFDEATQMLKSRVLFVLGWAGSARAKRVRVVYGTNPPLSDEGNWLFGWFAPWLDLLFPNPAKPGELRWYVNNAEGDPIWVEGPGQWPRGDGEISTAKSRTFIPAKLDDNKFLRDTGYRAQLESLPEPLRSAVKNGDWMASRQDDAQQVLPSAWLRAAQQRWKPENSRQAMLALGVDVAGGGPDREVIAPLHVGNHFAEPIAHKGVDTKDGFATAGRIVAAQRNGAPIAIDMTGGWGGAAKTALKSSEVDAYGVVFSNASGGADPNSKIPFANMRAEMYWNFRLALDPKGTENIALPPGAALLAEGSAPRWNMKGGRLYIESKEEIKDRIGVSTDVLDAIVIAWHIRAKGIVKQMTKGPKSQPMVVAESDPYALDGI